MKLVDAIALGRFCGLNTVEECIANIELHYWWVVSYSELSEKKEIFYKDVKAYELGTLELDWDYINAEIEKQNKVMEEYYKMPEHDYEDLDWELELFR
jgi:hypothetical protein